MFFVHLRRITRTGFINFWRNGFVAMASVFVLSITLFVIGSLLLGSAYLNSSLDALRNRVDISVSFQPDAAESSVLALKGSLQERPEVKEVTYTSREEELRLFRERHKDNPLLLQSLDEVGNPFGARLAIKATDPSQYQTIASFLESQDGTAAGGSGIIDEITFKQDLVNRLVGLINTSENVGFAVSMVLVAMSILVTYNTISLAIYNAREEISVMRLVGAQDNYIRGPFMVEGVIAGIIASLIALVALYPAVVWVKNVTMSAYGGINLVTYYWDNFGQILLVLVISGTLLGVVSSYLAVRQYIKV